MSRDEEMEGAARSNRLGRQPLHRAVLRGDVVEVRRLLSSGADVNAADLSQETSLHAATFLGHEELVTLLLEHGANPRAQNMESRCPLCVAIQHHHNNLVALFLRAGTSVETPEIGISPLMNALTIRNQPAAIMLLQRGASLTLSDGQNMLWWCTSEQVNWILYHYSGSLQGLTTPAPKRNALIAAHQRFRTSVDFSKHYSLIQRCDPLTAQVLQVLTMIYFLRVESELSRLPWEMFCMVAAALLPIYR